LLNQFRRLSLMKFDVKIMKWVHKTTEIQIHDEMV